MKGHNDIFLYSIVFNHICFRAQLFFPEVGLLCQLCCACDFIKGSLLSPSTVPYNHMRRHHKSRFAVRSQSVLAQTFRVDAYYRKISCCSNLITLLLRKLLVLRSYYINSIFLNQYVKPFTLLSQSLSSLTSHSLLPQMDNTVQNSFQQSLPIRITWGCLGPISQRFLLNLPTVWPGPSYF